MVVRLVVYLLWTYRREWGQWGNWPGAQGGRRVVRVGLVAALGVALALLTAWLLQATIAPQTLWAFTLLWFLFYSVITICLLTPRPTRTSNLVLAGVVAATVASWWYFPELHFATFFGELVFGSAGRPDALGSASAADYLQPQTWFFYLKALAWDQLGIVAVAAVSVALLGLRHMRRDLAVVGRHDGPNGVVLMGAALGATLLLFTLSPFRDHARSIAPLLPAVTTLAVVGLRRWSNALVGGSILIILLGWQIAQFTLLTLPQGEILARRLQPWGLIVNGSYQYWPDSGISAGEWHVAPDLLTLLQPAYTGGDRVKLALLINEVQLHQNTLRAEFEMLAPGTVRVVPLTKESTDPFAALFEAPFVLYKTGLVNDLSPEAQAAVARLNGGEDDLFATAFTTIWQRPLADGTRLVLAQRRHALVPDSVRDSYLPLMETLRPLLTPADGLVVDNPAQVNALGAFGWPETDVTTSPTAGQPGQRLFAVLWNASVDTEPSLNQRAVRSTEWWFNNVHVISYVVPTGLHALEVTDSGALGSEQLTTVSFEQDQITAGGGLVTTLTWNVPADATTAPYRTVLELYNSAGTLLAQRDLPPDPTWATMPTPTQQTALILPTVLGPPPYCLLVARYDPATGTRLLTETGENHLTICAFD